MDQFLRLRAIPKVGEKGFFSSPTQIISASVVGGVTLNHLSWAATLSVPTAGLFLQGKVRCAARCTRARAIHLLRSARHARHLLHV